MRKNKNKNIKKCDIIYRIFSIILVVVNLITFGLLIYLEILPTIYLSLLLIICGLIVFFLVKALNNRRLKKWIKTTLSIPTILTSIFLIIVIFYLMGTLDFLSDIFDTGLRTDTYSVYVLKSSKFKNIKDLNDKIISVSDIKDSITNKAIDKLSEKIEFNKSEYDSISDSADSVLDGDADAFLALESNFEILKENDTKYNDLKVLYTFSITSKVKTLSSDKDVTKENFIIYISGIDTSGKVATKARSDVNILVAVNPIKNKILIVNTPRDYYVKLHSKKAMDKLTHAGIYGIEESVSTLEDFYDINIDYYARINFTTFINIVDKLGGIELDVPVKFCEQDSNRNDEQPICLNKGLQTLNGEEALALSRTRYTIAGGDRGRIENQALVLEAIIDKAISPRIIIKYNSLLNSVSNSLITNINQKSFTKLIKNQIRKKTNWTIETYSVDGTDASNVTYSTGGANAYVMNPKDDTVKKAKIMLDEILETNKYTTTTTTTSSNND